MSGLTQAYASSHRPAADLSHFYVILVVSNPVRYERRYQLYWKTLRMCVDAGVSVVTVEAQLGDRPFMVTHAGNPNHVQLRTVEELWHKENLINIGIGHAVRLDPLAREVMWLDADCFPMLPAREWFEETWHALQHYEFVQAWEYLINFGPQNQPVSSPQMSFMKTYNASGFEVLKAKAGIKHTLAGHSGMISLGRPGLAWAANMSALNAIGGLIDFCILGSGDHHMALGLVGAMDQGTYEFRLSKYSECLLEWQTRAERWVKRDVGYVAVTVGHWWHGNKADRGYGSRGSILVNNSYNPHTDIKYDASGLLQLETYEPRQIRLRDQVRHYFRSRNEDSVDVR